MFGSKSGGVSENLRDFGSLSEKELDTVCADPKSLEEFASYLIVHNEVSESEIQPRIKAHNTMSFEVSRKNSEKIEAVENEDYALAE
jgi:hypothetical protein